MKSLRFFAASALLSLLFTQNGLAQPPKGKAKPGTVYGAKFNNENTTEAVKLPGMLTDKDTIVVKVKGKVLDACASKGCWMT